MNKSPWLDHNFENLFLNELSFAEDPIVGPQNKPLKVFDWIHRNKAKPLLFKSLAEFAPYFLTIVIITKLALGYPHLLLEVVTPFL